MRLPDGTLPDFAGDGLADIRTICAPPPCFCCGRHHEFNLSFVRVRAVLLKPTEFGFCDCGRVVDLTVCWCGVQPAQHANENHGFVPYGCDCYRDRGPS